MDRSIEPNGGKTREELERALAEISDSEGRYHVRQALQLLEAEGAA